MPVVRKTDPSLFRHRIEYERNNALDAAASDSSSLDGYGGVVDDWVLFSPVMARVETISGFEPEYEHKNFGEATHRVTHWFIGTPGNTIRVRDRIRFEGRIFAVLHINDFENWHEEQRVLCVETVT